MEAVRQSDSWPTWAKPTVIRSPLEPEPEVEASAPEPEAEPEASEETGVAAAGGQGESHRQAQGQGKNFLFHSESLLFRFSRIKPDPDARFCLQGCPDFLTEVYP